MIYTRKGDAGSTSLANGEQVSKCSPHIHYYGLLDELSSHIGLLVAQMQALELTDGSLLFDIRLLQTVQQFLFNLSVDGGSTSLMEKYPTPGPEDVAMLEAQIDYTSKQLGGLFHGFVLPSGHPVAAQAHVTRTVCRRVERELYELMELHPNEAWRMSQAYTMPYINRLSDYLYALTKKINHLTGYTEKKAH